MLKLIALIGTKTTKTVYMSKHSGFTPGTPVFAHYTSLRRWYAPHDLAKENNSEIERVTEMDIC